MKEDDEAINAVVKMAKKTFDGVEVMPEAEFESLIDDCKSIMTESIVLVRQDVIECKWSLGDRLLASGEERITPLLKRVAESISISERDLFYCLAFRKKYDSIVNMWKDVPEGKNISWHKLVNNYIDFSLPKPVVPVEEKYDEWGVIKWWSRQPGLKSLKLKDKDSNIVLTIKANKVIDGAERGVETSLTVKYAEVSDYYIGLKGWDKKHLDRNDYNRMWKAIKTMMEKSDYDTKKVIGAIKWCYDKYLDSPIDWTLETVVKKYPEACKVEKPYAKYMKKGEKKRW